MASPAHQARSLYRRFLRELPIRRPSILANPSPVQHLVRADLSPSPNSNTTSGASLDHQRRKAHEHRLHEAEEYLQYLKAQREYITLIERYNPGMNMAEEDRVRLTARRVGMDLPVEWVDRGKKE
ncbi:hypothetical protein LTR62_005205 [Meristemomyces frigidus]|uniref:ATP synthase assembly factor FMC1, mitochondrial n=1 Tax=Meristemomyces frigidus TaxID=1508187 RepID=A0AAN7TLC0_9PEZI|nr:hypothetical protein LTR62_005205 [Meristemomyces frigidus]